MRLENMAKIRCWKNICVSNQLSQKQEMINFAKKNKLKIMDGKWLLKNMVDQVVEYVVDWKKELWQNQEVTILCQVLDETIMEKIKEICVKVKICNILTKHSKQYQKLEEEVYQTNGIILNVSNNVKRAALKSSVIINFDFSESDLEKCVFSKNACMIQVSRNIDMDKKKFEGKNIISYEIEMPEKYLEFQEKLEDFSNKVLYESFIFKHTNYKNIKKELLQDRVKIVHLQATDKTILKNGKKNSSKMLDKITI